MVQRRFIKFNINNMKFIILLLAILLVVFFLFVFSKDEDSIKVTKLTIRNTYIGGVYIAVNLPGNDSFGMAFFNSSDRICRIHKGSEWGVMV